MIEVIQSVIHHCQKPSESTCKIKVCPEYHFRFVRRCYLLPFKMYHASEMALVVVIRLVRMLYVLAETVCLHIMLWRSVVVLVTVISW
jgi:hypothetical protein